MKELADIDLRYSRVTANGVDSLRTALPKVKVQYVGAAAARPKNAAAAKPANNTDRAIAAWIKALGGATTFAGNRLRSVDLSSSPITDAQLSYLSGLTGLESLNLSVTQIGDMGLASLEHLTALKSLDLSQTTGLGCRAGKSRGHEAASELQDRRHPGGRQGADEHHGHRLIEGVGSFRAATSTTMFWRMSAK